MDAAVGIVDVKSYYVETPADIADFERLIDRVCELHARKGMADIAAEYRDARLVLRTRILMLMAGRPKRLIDFLEEAEHGGR
jgi:hypothetical protein